MSDHDKILEIIRLKDQAPIVLPQGEREPEFGLVL